MPRRQPARSSPATPQPSSVVGYPIHEILTTIKEKEKEKEREKENEKDKEKEKDGLHKDTGAEEPLHALLGGNPQFADQFFGEPGNMVRPLRPATPQEGAGNDEVNMSGATPAQNSRPQNMPMGINPQLTSTYELATPHIPRSSGPSHSNIEHSSINIDLIVREQLHQDLSAYRYDLDFVTAQLSPANAANMTPAETRTFQLRLLDLGHQMRMVHHRIQLMMAATINSFSARNAPGIVGATLSNAYYGPYPPGTSVQPGANGYQNPGAGSGIATPRNGGWAQPDRDHFNADFHRRGPGRPPGSKNRHRQSHDSQQPQEQPQALSANGPIKAAALASAAALATAGVKRDDYSEIRVATLNGVPSGSTDVADDTTSEHPSKRIRLDSQIGSPVNDSHETDERPTQSVITAASNSQSNNPSNNPSIAQEENNEELADEEMRFHAMADHNSGRRPSATPRMRPTSSGLIMTPHGRSSLTVPAFPPGSPFYTGPAGGEFKRLGGWRCRLCTSQKYLNAPPPKQPSEPGHWPLRDISKMVTHFTRMHGEHNNVERCMELGAALGANRGPFRHWLQITKKEKGIDEAAIDTIVDELDNGHMPAVLRKVSTSAANFPRD